MKYLGLNQETERLILFRKSQLCQHKFSCAENSLHKAYSILGVYFFLRTLAVESGIVAIGLEHLKESGFQQELVDKAITNSPKLEAGFIGALWLGIMAPCILRSFN